jgi:hypothetical protein
MVPFVIRVLLVLYGNTFEGLDVLMRKIWAQIRFWMEKVCIWLQIEMECGVEGRELKSDGIVFGDDV